MDYRDIDYRLKQLIDRPASNHLLSHISHQASLVIPCHHTNLTSVEQYKSPIPPLPTFVNLLAERSLAKTGTLLASLVLLDRLRQRLAQFARGMPCTCQRIFLATLIVTTKTLHDTSPKNKHWTKYAVYFTLPEVNLMEKQLLALMNYQLVITEQDMYYIFIKYDNTTMKVLPPLSSSTYKKNDRHYLPKSASFNSPSSSNSFYKGNNHHHYSLSNIILQQQQQQQLPQKYHKAKKSTAATTAKKNSNKKRLYISTSNSSSSSLSSATSMDDLLVVTPTATTSNTILGDSHNKKHLYVNNNINMWLDPGATLLQHTVTVPQQQHYTNFTNQSYYHGNSSNILFKN